MDSGFPGDFVFFIEFAICVECTRDRPTLPGWIFQGCSSAAGSERLSLAHTQIATPTRNMSTTTTTTITKTNTTTTTTATKTTTTTITTKTTTTTTPTIIAI